MKALLRRMKKGLPISVRKNHTKNLGFGMLGGLQGRKQPEIEQIKCKTLLDKIMEVKWALEFDSGIQQRRCHECDSFSFCYCSGSSEHVECQISLSSSTTSSIPGSVSPDSLVEAVEDVCQMTLDSFCSESSTTATITIQKEQEDEQCS
ncbi:hypothetical protein BIW11_06352 [Tropilaelaps mercedesae]|uniref:Uncharacterized protein n=1 Tax=Tropilaelaps mercedesae TaxID=418985 RepID=A0A1V9XYC9_9ACAR|nr:hypothetical protein BIW11_06352 [Tropilaelaps mercedesae]